MKNTAALKWHILYLRINPASIGFFRFILEGYDGLAILSTADQKNGIVTLRFPESSWSTLPDVLVDLHHKLTD